MKRIALFALAGVLAWAALAWAQSPNFIIEKPRGWSGQQAAQAGGLEAQFVAPGRDAFIEVYAQPSGPVDLEWYADEWVRLVAANGVPHHDLVTNAMSSTNAGVPGLVREYTGHDQGNAFRSLLIFSHYNGFMYIAQGVWIDSADQANLRAVYTSLDSFGFPGSQHQAPVQPSVQPPAPGYQGQADVSRMGSTGRPDRAWNDDGRCGAQWGLVQGGNSGDCFFSVSTSQGINLHLRNTTGNARDLFRVEIADMENNMALVAREEHVGPAVRKIPLPPGVYRVLVASQSPGMVPWKAYWD